MIGAIVCLAEAVILAAAILTVVAIIIGRLDRGDDRAAIGRECAEMDEQLSDEPVPYWPDEDLEALVRATREPPLRWLPEDDDIPEGKRAL